MKYVFDIDGTICSTNSEDYSESEPIRSRIEKINRLYDRGNYIVFQTARGMGRTSNDQKKSIDMFYDLTYNQLLSWGVKFHELFLGKPAGDLYIDDKGISDESFFRN